MEENAIPARVLFGSFALTVVLALGACACIKCWCRRAREESPEHTAMLAPSKPRKPSMGASRQAYERVECDVDTGDAII